MAQVHFTHPALSAGAPWSLGPPNLRSQPQPFVLPRLFLSNNFDTGQKPGITITPANSGLNGQSAWDAVTGAPWYDMPSRSGYAAHIDTNGIRQFTWSSIGVQQTRLWGQFYFYPTGFGAGVRIGQANGNITVNLPRIALLTTTGAVNVNVAGGPGSATTTIPTLNAWNRVEYLFTVNGTTCTSLANLYVGANVDGLIPNETVTRSDPSADTSLVSVLFGVGSAVGADMFYDEFSVNNFGWTGPVIYPNPPAPVPFRLQLRGVRGKLFGPPILLTQGPADPVVVTITNVNVVDAASGTDASSLTANLPQTDSAVGTDASRVMIQQDQYQWATRHPRLRPWTTPLGPPVLLVQQQVQPVYFIRADAATGTDASLLTANLPRTESAAGSDASLLTATYLRPDSATGTDASTLTATFARTDAATATDASRLSFLPDSAFFPLRHPRLRPYLRAAGPPVLLVQYNPAPSATFLLIPVTDTGTGTDVSHLTANFTRPDAGTGSDVSNLTASYPRTDSGTGSDVSTLKATYVRVDSGVGTDASTLSFLPDAAFYPLRHPRLRPFLRNVGPPVLIQQQYEQPVYLIRSDSGTGSDVSSLTATFLRTDAAVGTDFSSILTPLDVAFFPLRHPRLKPWSLRGGPPILLIQQPVETRVWLFRSDTGVGTDVSTLTASLPRADSATGTDVSSLKATFSRTEAGLGSDVSHLTANYPRTDSGHGTDFIAGRTIAVRDTGTGSDVSILKAKFTRTDAGVGSDVSTLTARLNRVEFGFGSDISHLTIIVGNQAFFKVDVNDVLKFKLDVTPSITLFPVSGLAHIVFDVSTKAKFTLNITKV